MLDYLEVVHVLIRGSRSSGQALHRAGQTHRGDHPSAGLPDEERSQELASGIRQDFPAAYVRSWQKYSDEQKHNVLAGEQLKSATERLKERRGGHKAVRAKSCLRL